MYYPLNLNNLEISPLFGNQLQGEPQVIDLSSNNQSTFDVNTDNFDEFQNYIFSQLEHSNSSWGISRYLEERSGILRNYSQIINEERVYHVGLDIIAPFGAKIFAPISGTVYECGREEEHGSYGGYVILRHELENEIFYSFYGHFQTPHIVEVGQGITAVQQIGSLGERADSGGWFTHTHLQIITELARLEGRMHEGYTTPETLRRIDYLFPNPGFLFRY